MAVSSICSEPQSYVIQLDDGRLFRQTRCAINMDKGVPAVGVSVMVPCSTRPAPDPYVRIGQPAGQPVPTPALLSQSAVPTSLPSDMSQTPSLPVGMGCPGMPNSPATPSGFIFPCPVRLVGCVRGVPRRLSQSQQNPLAAVVPSPTVPSSGQQISSHVDHFGTTRSGARFGISMPKGGCWSAG